MGSAESRERFRSLSKDKAKAKPESAKGKRSDSRNNGKKEFFMSKPPSTFISMDASTKQESVWQARIQSAWDDELS